MAEGLFIRGFQQFYIGMVFQLASKPAVLLKQPVSFGKKCCMNESLSLVNSSIMPIINDVKISIFKELSNCYCLLFTTFFR